MFKHSFTASGLTAMSDSHLPSTMLIVAVLNVEEPEQSIEMVKRCSGQALADLFNEMDRPDAQKVIVGVQFASPPQLNGSSRWTVEAVLDFARAKLSIEGNSVLDTYAYRLASDAIFMDNSSIDQAGILEWRSLYGACNADGTRDPQLVAHQTWLSTVITRMVNAVNLPDEEGDTE